MKIGIITDSTSDLPEEIAQEWGIRVVPTIITMNGKTYLDGEGMSREEFYKLLPGMKNPPTTAAPSPEAFKQACDSQFQQGYDHLIILTAPARLSGIFNAASIASAKFPEKVSIFDSGQLSMGLGFQALHAARLTKDGHGLENVLAELNVIREKIKLFAMLDSTTQLKRSGRVSWTRSIVSDLLRIKPFIQLKEGNVLRHGFSRTRSSGKKQLEQLLTSFGNMEYLAVLHTNAYQEAQLFLELVKERVDFQPLIINVTTIIGNHVGSKGLGFVCLPA